MSISLSVVTPPTVEPISLTDAKDHLRVGITDDDELIKVLVVAAREKCETETSRAIPVSTYRLVMDCWQDTLHGSRNERHCRGDYQFLHGCGDCINIIELPVPPLVSVASISYIDASGMTQALNPSLYRVDTNTTPGRIIPLAPWPKLGTSYGGIIIQFTAGYSVVPASIKQAMLLIVGTLYDNRASEGDKQTFPLSMTVCSLLSSYQWGRYL